MKSSWMMSFLILAVDSFKASFSRIQNFLSLAHNDYIGAAISIPFPSGSLILKQRYPQGKPFGGSFTSTPKSHMRLYSASTSSTRNSKPWHALYVFGLKLPSKLATMQIVFSFLSLSHISIRFGPPWSLLISAPKHSCKSQPGALGLMKQCWYRLTCG